MLWCLASINSAALISVISHLSHLTEHFKADVSVDNNQGTFCLCNIPAQSSPVQFTPLPWSKKQGMILHDFWIYCQHHEIPNVQMWSFSSLTPPFFFFVKFLFWVAIWKHLSLNGPLVHLQTISSESQKELGHPTIHGHMQKGGIEGSGRGESRILSQTIEWLHELTLKRICRKALCKESINPKRQIPIYRGSLTEFGAAGWGLLVCCFLVWS